MQKSLKNISYTLRNLVVIKKFTVICIVCKFIYHYNHYRHYYHSEVEEEIRILFNFIKKYIMQKSLKNISYILRNLVVIKKIHGYMYRLQVYLSL